MQTFMKQLGIEWPIFQAPIGSVASPSLAAAVSDAGGLGHIACTWRRPEQLTKLIQEMRARTERPFGANFVVAFPIDALLGIALDNGVTVVSFFWEDASFFLPRVRAAGATAMQVVGSVEEAKRAAGAGFDLIVAQGREAGGHVRGQLGTMTLLPQVVDAVGQVPVIAAGGIADRRAAAAARALGAAGVWVGTRFLAAREANIHRLYQEMILASSGDDTIYTELFDVGWPNAPLRTLRNSTVRLWEQAGRPLPSQRPGEGETVARRADGTAVPRYHFGSPTRDVEGDVEAMALYAGEAVGLVRKVEGAADIVRDLASAWQ